MFGLIPQPYLQEIPLSSAVTERVAIVAPVATGETATPLTLEEAVKLALEQNPSLKAATARNTEAEEQTAEARSYRRPAFTLNTVYTGFDRGQGATLALPGVPAVSFQTAPRDTSSLVVGGELPLDISRQIQSNIQLADINKEAVRYAEAATRNRLIARVQEAYFAALQAQELVAVAEQAVQTAKEQERTADAYVLAGTATRFETLRAATQTADSRQNLLVAQNRASLALASLANVIGVPGKRWSVIGEPATEKPGSDGQPLAGRVTPIAYFPSAVQTSLPTLADAQRLALETRPEVKQAEAAVRAAEAAARVADAQDRPTAGVGVQYQRSPRPGFGQVEDLGALTLRLTVPIYDRGTSNARVRQAKAQRDAALETLQAVKNDIALEVQQAWQEQQEAENRLTIARAAQTQATEQYRLAENRYKAGINLRGDFSSPLLEISDARTALVQSQTNFVNARYDIVKSQARLAGAMGAFVQAEVRNKK